MARTRLAAASRSNSASRMALSFLSEFQGIDTPIPIVHGFFPLPSESGMSAAPVSTVIRSSWNIGIVLSSASASPRLAFSTISRAILNSLLLSSAATSNSSGVRASGVNDESTGVPRSALGDTLRSDLRLARSTSASSNSSIRSYSSCASWLCAVCTSARVASPTAYFDAATVAMCASNSWFCAVNVAARPRYASSAYDSFVSTTTSRITFS